MEVFGVMTDPAGLTLALAGNADSSITRVISVSVKKGVFRV